MSRGASYRTAIATGLSALLVTITPQPAVAAALALLVSEQIGGQHRASAEQSAYGYDSDEDDGYAAYDARRAWSTPTTPRPPQRLWDRYTD